MATPATAQPLPAQQRRQLAWLLLAWALFVVYGSWVPLHFQWRDPGQVWTALWHWSDWQGLRGERLDTAVNVLLTVPLGFGLALLWAGPRERTPMMARVAIVLLVGLLSVGVEWGQGFLPGRNASLGDVLAQTAGTLLGLALQAGYGRRAHAWLAATGTALGARSRAAHLLHGYLLALLLFAVMPLDLTLDLGELYGKWRSGRVSWLPLHSLRGTTAEIVYELVSDVLLWLPVGLLWRLDQPQRKALAIAGQAALLALAIECAQLFVLSRVSDSTDVLLAALGAWLGAAVLPPAWRRLSASSPDAQRRTRLLGLLVWLLAVVWIYTWPLALREALPGPADFARAFVRVPFVGYFQRDEFGALNEMLRKLLVFLPGGALARLWLATARRTAVRSALPLALLALLALTLEAVQVLLADRVADLTDALLATLGAAAGWRLAGWLQSAPRGPEEPAHDPARDRAAAPAPAAARAAAAADRPRFGGLIGHGLSVLGLAVALWLLARLPGVPYNVVKLLPAGPGGVLAALGIALAAWWLAALPVALLRIPRHLALGLPLWLLLHGLVSFTVLRLTVALRMLHKVIGSPVLAWPGPLEDVARYLVLHTALLLPLCGAAALVQVLRRPAALAGLVSWLLWVAALAWPLHWALVEQAATDNLVELMRGGGSFAVSTLLALAILTVGTAAAALACLSSAAAPRRALLPALLLAVALAPAALLAALEPALFKYGRVFSALQFMLSASRDAYASGADLAWRFAAAQAGIIFTLAWLQRPWWRDLPPTGTRMGAHGHSGRRAGKDGHRRGNRLEFAVRPCQSGGPTQQGPPPCSSPPPTPSRAPTSPAAPWVRSPR